MKKILEFLKNWFERNGFIKLLVAFLLLILSVIIGRNVPSLEKVCTWIAIISGCYVVLTALVFTIAGIVNSIKDIIAWRKKRNEEENNNTQG